jgi:hypothetical protein
MEIWKDVELYEQGLKRFDSLTPLQRDWFTIKNLDIYYEMIRTGSAWRQVTT